jgi:hypothetical protein
LDGLLAEAQRIAEQRAKALELIHQTEAALLAAEHDLTASQERQAQEEFEAAQADGGLAVASRETQQTVAKGELLVKSVGFRLRGLQPKLGTINEALLRAWEGVEAHIDAALAQQVSDLSDEFDAAVENLISVAWKAIVIRKHAPRQLESRGAFGIDGVFSLSVFNPLRTLAAMFVYKPSEVPGSGLHNGMVNWRGLLLGKLKDNWDASPEARALDGEMRAAEDRVAPISAVVAALRSKR